MTERKKDAAEKFDVYEVEIRNPDNRSVMTRGLSAENAEAFIMMAIARRGVETHFYTKEPSYA